MSDDQDLGGGGKRPSGGKQEGAPAKRKPGEIPEPPERPWDAEGSNPFDGIDRSDPFAGRPRAPVPPEDQPRSEGPGFDPGPGQPLPPDDDASGSRG